MLLRNGPHAYGVVTKLLHWAFWLHVSSHVAFFAALACHVGLVVGKRLLRRML